MSAPVSPAMRRFILGVDRFVMWVTLHWLFLASSALFIFITLPLLAPVLMHYGYTGPAQLIYLAYHFTCHELAFRTYFLFGAQPVYTLDQLRAQVPAAGDDFFFWSGFLGNAALGYKMSWCERDVAIFGSMFLGSLLFGLLRTRLKPLDWRLYLVLLMPLAVDGFTQLLGWRESDYVLRTVTGVLLGLGTVWTMYPHLEKGMQDAQSLAQAQWQRALAREAARPREKS